MMRLLPATRPRHHARILALALLVLTATGASAQSTRPGSIYTRFGLGQRIDGYQLRSPSMGGPGYALGGGVFTSLANPALLSDLNLTRAAAGVEFESTRAKNAAGATSDLTSGSLAGFSIGIPLMASRLGISMSFTPWSRIGYRVFNEDTFLDSDGQDVTYGSSLEGNGGLDRASLGVGFRIADRVSVGLRGDFLFGIFEDVQRTSFFDSRYEPVRLSEATRVRGLGLGLGVRASVPSVLRDGDVLSMGVAVDLPASLTGERVITEGEIADPDTLVSGFHGSMDIPVGVGAGLAYQAGPGLAAIADVRYERWSRFDSTFPLAGVADGTGGRLDDRLRLSGGIEFLPAGRDLLAGFLRRSAYRFGLFYEESYVTPVHGTRITMYGLTGGISFPTLFSGTRVDVHAEVGKRGSTEGMLIQDTYFRIGFSVNFADRWFVRPRHG